jgi:hypothetical protein
VRAGGGCTLCHPEIEEILAELRGEPVDAALAIENQSVCRQETLARIEGAIAALVAPRLASRGVRIVALDVDGLQVTVHVLGPPDSELLGGIARRLHGAVCEDLEVRVEIAS